MEQEILGSVVEQIGTDETPGVGIVFDTGQLTIFYAVARRGIEDFSELVGHSLIDINEVRDTTKCLKFSNGAEIEVDLNSSEENGPESMVFYGIDGSIVVWN